MNHHAAIIKLIWSKLNIEYSSIWSKLTLHEQVKIFTSKQIKPLSQHEKTLLAT